MSGQEATIARLTAALVEIEEELRRCGAWNERIIKAHTIAKEALE